MKKQFTKQEFSRYFLFSCRCSEKPCCASD